MSISYNIDEIPERDIAVLRVSGMLTFEARSDFNKAAHSLLDSSLGKLVIDLSRVTRISSVFLGTITDVSVKAEEKGAAFSVMAKDPLVDLFQKAGIDKVVTVIRV